MIQQMEDILTLLRKNDLSERRKALELLWNWDNALDLDDTLEVLRLAGLIKPISDEEWDNPSDALVTAACMFIQNEMIPVIENNIINYSYSAANKVLSYVLLLQTEESVSLYKKIIGNYIFQSRLVPEYEEMKLIADEKDCLLIAMETLVENEANFHPWYIEYYHYLVAHGFQKHYLKPEEVLLDKEYIENQLAFVIQMYEEYHSDYRYNFVYEAWKNRYLHMRFFLKNYMTLYSIFCSDEQLEGYRFILDWKDNTLRLHYIEILWQRQLDVEFSVIDQILKSDDGPIEAYTLLRTYKPELIPTDITYQEYYVREAAAFHFFSHSGIYKFPDGLEVMGSFEVVDFYEDRLTYYMLRYKSSDPMYTGNGWMRMLAGAYMTQSLPTGYQVADLWDIHTDYVSWDDKDLSGHEEDFRKWLAEKHDMVAEEEVFYNYFPKFDRKANTVALLFAFVFLVSIWISEWFVLGLMAIPIWWLLKFFHGKRIEKNVFVQLRGYYMDFYCFDEGTCVTLNQIHRIELEKRTLARENRYLFLPMKTWHFVFYGEDELELYCIPRNYLEEEFFFPILKQRSAHLVQPPALKWEQDIA
jgi:hypothetical protein